MYGDYYSTRPMKKWSEAASVRSRSTGGMGMAAVCALFALMLLQIPFPFSGAIGADAPEPAHRSTSGEVRFSFERGSGFLAWNRDEQRLSVVAVEVPVYDFLAALQAATGWTIFAQPGMDHRINAEIDNLPGLQSIRRIAWNAGYSLEHGGSRGIRLMIYRDSSSSATDRITGGHLMEVIPDYQIRKIGDELIVRVEPGADVDIESLAASLGARVIGRIPEANAWRLKFEDEDAAEAGRKVLESRQGIRSVENNLAVSRPDIPGKSVLLPNRPINIRSAPGSSDSTVVIGLIDTAVSSEVSKSEYANFLLPAESMQTAGDGGTPAGPVETDDLTHGTSMFQTIMQGLGITATPENQTFDVKVLPVDVYGQSQETNTFLVAAAAARAIENGADIINLSLGGDQPSAVLADVIEFGSQNGVLFIAAAGNEPVTDPTYPAAYPDVLAVTSMTRDGSIASFANRGDFVDVAAPGSSVISWRGMSFLASGTSVSTAYISGIAAGIASQTGQDIKAVESSIRSDFKTVKP